MTDPRAVEGILPPAESYEHRQDQAATLSIEPTEPMNTKAHQALTVLTGWLSITIWIPLY
jgi:hypothetical protein